MAPDCGQGDLADPAWGHLHEPMAVEAPEDSPTTEGGEETPFYARVLSLTGLGGRYGRVQTILSRAQVAKVVDPLEDAALSKFQREALELAAESASLVDTAAEKSVMGTEKAPEYCKYRRWKSIPKPVQYVGGISAYDVDKRPLAELLEEGLVHEVVGGRRVWESSYAPPEDDVPVGPPLAEQYVDYSMLDGPQPPICGLPDITRNGLVPFIAAGKLYQQLGADDAWQRDQEGRPYAKLAGLTPVAALRTTAGALMHWSTNLDSRVLRAYSHELPSQEDDPPKVKTVWEAPGLMDPTPAPSEASVRLEGACDQERVMRQVEQLQKLESEQRRQIIIDATSFDSVYADMTALHKRVAVGSGYFEAGELQPPVCLQYVLPWCNGQQMAMHEAWAMAHLDHGDGEHVCLFAESPGNRPGAH